MITVQDQELMALALRLAKRGQYTTSPNPCVGCVITDGETLAEGWHEKAGQGHAEVNAIRAAKAKGMLLSKCTLYVTLEPCSHQGKTPPCSDAIIDEGFRRVVFSMEDPNPEVSGKGLQRLKAAGIVVDGPLMTNEAMALNEGFIQRMRDNRPKVVAKMATSFDGRTAMANGESQWITGSDARQDVQRLRALSCAIITGIGTVLADDPAMTVRDQQLALADGTLRQPLRVVVDSQCRIPLTAKILQYPDQVLIVHASPAHAHMSVLNEAGVETMYLADSKGRVDLTALLVVLAERQCNQVMVEAGSTLLGAFLQDQLIDEMFCYMAPTLMGSEAKPLADFPLFSMQQQMRLTVKDLRSVGTDYRWQLIPDYPSDVGSIR